MNSQVKIGDHSVGGARLAKPSVWPYVSDRLEIRWLDPAYPAAIWISPFPRVSTGDLPMHERRHHKPPSPTIFYRLTPVVFAKLVAGMEKLVAKVRSTGGRPGADVCGAAAALVELGDWLVEESGAYAAQDLAAAWRTVAAGSVGAMARPEIAKQEMETAFWAGI